MSEIAICTRQLAKSFAGREGLRPCSLTVERGTLYALLGKNGAGKTTLFKLLLGFLRPTAGSAAVLGLDCLRQTAEVLRHTGCLIETPVFYEHLSAAENLRLHLACMECSADPAPLLARVGLDCADDRPVRAYSLGMRQRLALARALSHRSEVLILDEPFNGLDPVGQREMAALFRQLSRAEGFFYSACGSGPWGRPRWTPAGWRPGCGFCAGKSRASSGCCCWPGWSACLWRAPWWWASPTWCGRCWGFRPSITAPPRAPWARRRWPAACAPG